MDRAAGLWQQTHASPWIGALTRTSTLVPSPRLQPLLDVFAVAFWPLQIFIGRRVRCVAHHTCPHTVVAFALTPDGTAVSTPWATAHSLQAARCIE
ncbi:hypothetical protein ACCO45_008839 [Purpureocillium lilacinum]|uniref:Uncharacterized protein n=1 Tax=Purpureocillium lilacinum TaxID=33203 RepID=A0ACC4DIT3_PURLI